MQLLKSSLKCEAKEQKTKEEQQKKNQEKVETTQKNHFPISHIWTLGGVYLNNVMKVFFLGFD